MENFDKLKAQKDAIVERDEEAIRADERRRIGEKLKEIWFQEENRTGDMTQFIDDLQPGRDAVSLKRGKMPHG